MIEILFHIALIFSVLGFSSFVIQRIASYEYRQARKLTRRVLQEGTIPAAVLMRHSWRGKQTDFNAGMRAELRAFEAKTRGTK